VADTADINGGTIDGTAIGGSTAAAGAFTTLSATGLFSGQNQTFFGGPVSMEMSKNLFFSGGNWLHAVTGAGMIFQLDTSTLDSKLFTAPSASAGATAVLTQRGSWGTAGFNGAIGATTPSTGAFTTLKASQSSALGSFGAGAAIVVQNTDAGTFNASEFRALDSGGNVAGGLSIRNAAHGVSGSSDAFIVVKNAGTLVAPVYITSTGLAVTGALSSTGILSGPGFRASKVTATSGLVKIQDEGANSYNVIGSRNNADNAALPLTFQASNFAFAGAVAVTGELSSTGALSIGNTVNTVTATLPNRTITMVIGGTTYYIHAKTTND
jgi:hypothetical protein